MTLHEYFLSGGTFPVRVKVNNEKAKEWEYPLLSQETLATVFGFKDGSYSILWDLFGEETISVLGTISTALLEVVDE